MTVDPEKLVIEEISEPIVLNYFTTINNSEFEETAALFAEEGILYAPFTSPVVGRENIAAYLQAEAAGMKLIPREGVVEKTDSDSDICTVMGKVQTALFSVNVRWQLLLDGDRNLASVRVKLLASPEELLKLRQ